MNRNRHTKSRPKIPLKPTLFFWPDVGCSDDPDLYSGVIGWAYVHPRTLKVLSGQHDLGTCLDAISSVFLRCFRPLSLHWPYWDKMRLHYPFVRVEEMRRKSQVERAVFDAIRRFSAQNDYRMTCSQTSFAFRHVTGEDVFRYYVLLRHLRRLGHDLSVRELPQAYAIMFLYYEQKTFWDKIQKERGDENQGCEE